MAKKLFIKTYGCQMNVYDSGRMAEVLAPLGYAVTDAPDGADMVVLNTCHIREKAAEKVFSELGRLKLLRRARAEAGQDMLIAVAGCVAQAEGAEILRRAPQVDIVVGPQTYHRLPELVAQAIRNAADQDAADRDAANGGWGETPDVRRGILDTEFPADSKFDRLPAARRAEGPAAFLSVQEGCDKFCTFCVVPYTRGAEYSRPASQILAEARRLVDRGVAEITLLGQNVNAYHGAAPAVAVAANAAGRAEWGLGRLIRALAEIDGLARLRYTTSHPRDMDDDLIAAHAEVPALMPYLHLPVQSGSDRMLAAMNRRHRVADYLALVDRLRAARTDLALSSDFIVGFPGESDADFAATLDLVARVGFAQAYSFKYSPRPGTPAAASADRIAEPLSDERLARLQALIKTQQDDFNRAAIGRVLPVLFERDGRHEGQLIGRSPYMQGVHAVAPAALKGRVADVEITGTQPNSLAGRLVASAPRERAEPQRIRA